MLSVPSEFSNALNSTTRNFNIMVQLTRNTSGSVPIDISDRVLSYTTTHDFETRGGRLDLTLDNYDFTLSPQNRTSSMNLVGGVYDPLLDANHKVEVFEGILINSSNYEYVKKFEGYVGDDITVNSLQPQITLSCRDKSKLMQDRYIYQSDTYALYLVETVIQMMIDRFAPDLGITLQVPPSGTSFMIGRPTQPYTASDTNLWDACQLLADTASQELRFMEDGSLVIRPVIRDWTTLPVAMSVDESTLTDDSSSITDADVRNHIVVRIQNFPKIVAEDTDSIAKYGFRYMQVTRSVSDLLTDPAQGTELANNILWDLRYARPSQTSEIPLHPLVQVGDIIKIQNSRLGTNFTDDLFKVLTVENDYSKDKKRTRLTMQGFDKYVSSKDTAPQPIKFLVPSVQAKAIQNYDNSGWTGYEKDTYYPKLSWTPPTGNIANQPLPANFGGYLIERATQLSGNSSGNHIVSNWTWNPISAIPSYIDALGYPVDYFYDYSAISVLEQYKQAGLTASSVSLQYRVTATTVKGSKSTVSNPVTLVVNFPVYKDRSGNTISPNLSGNII